MYKLIFLIVLLSSSVTTGQSNFAFEASTEHAFGLPDTAYALQMLDWSPMIGECECKSLSRIDQNTWADTVEMIWRFKYIMNGKAVQDETLKADGKHAGSIRQYNVDSSRWYVHYYTSVKPVATLPAWEGNVTEKGDIVLYRDQRAPNGMEGKYKITFYNMSEAGFDWLGEWVSPDESFKYPTWKIYCKKKHPMMD